MEEQLHEANAMLEKTLPAFRCMTPWIERGKFVVMPADHNSGQFVIDLVNGAELTLDSHKLHAGWNLDLPEVALVSIKYNLASKRAPITLIEDERLGIARQNGWEVEGTEISYINSNPHKTNPNVTFVRAVVSRRVVGLIQQQSGKIWISGGTASVYWNGSSLDLGNQVQFNYQ